VGPIKAGAHTPKLERPGILSRNSTALSTTASFTTISQQYCDPLPTLSGLQNPKCLVEGCKQMCIIGTEAENGGSGYAWHVGIMTHGEMSRSHSVHMWSCLSIMLLYESSAMTICLCGALMVQPCSEWFSPARTDPAGLGRSPDPGLARSQNAYLYPYLVYLYP